jgi:peptidoglycan/xylan/chitin deacetylase (PgdA/CDA1 family)
LDDRITALTTKRRPRPSGRSPRNGARRSLEPHHRRRRAGAILALVALALIIAISAGSGGGPVVHHVAAKPTGFFGYIRTAGGDGPNSFAAQETAAENGAVDRTLAYTPYVRVAGAQHKEIALTFDDGPGPYTPRVLSVLAQENVPATFFQVGTLQTYFHDSTSQIVARGYTIGDHTESHAPMSKLSAADQKSQIIEQISAMGDFGAPFPRLFRPPYGLWDSTTLRILRQNRMLMILWTVDTEDYRQPGVPTIVNNVLTNARPGAIILMHDAGGNRTETAEALPQIITTLKAHGYKLVTVPRLLLDNPAPANQQVTGLAGGGG